MLNHIVIMGRLVRDPELRRTGNGIAVASFTVAVDRDFKSGENGKKETDFIDCVAWRNTGEFVSKYFSKGAMIVVSGRLQGRSWTDKDGNKRKTMEIVAENCYFGESKKDTGRTNDSSAPGGYPTGNYAPENYAGYAPPAAGYGSYPAYQVPSSEYAELTDDDSQLPF